MKKYLAFISYRHKQVDSDAALTFRKGIEGYHLPQGSGLPARRRVFRDTDELPTSADLGADIENALRDSEYLIALCSEDYVKSLWCMREIEFWLELGRRDRILPVLVSGTAETSVPEMIWDIPVVSDLTGGMKAKAAVPELLSRMSGMDAESFAGAERRFRMGAAGAAVACLTAGLLGFAVYASRTAARIADNNVRIEGAVVKTGEERKQAVEERNTALLRQAEYVSEGAWKALASGDADHAIELALSVLPEDPEGDLPVSPEAEGVLRMALSMEVPPSYHYLSSVETDFDIRGYYRHYRYTDRIVLTGDSFGTMDQYVDYAGGTGPLEDTEFIDMRQKAAGQGYTKLSFVRHSGSNRTFFYGPGKPLYSDNFLGGRHRDYTLDGEPFPADGVSALGEKYVLAWAEASGDRPARTVLFDIDRLEALTVLELSGHPVSVIYTDTYDRICIVDSSGALSVFNYQGEKLAAFDGTYTDLRYVYSSGPCAWVSSLDGNIYLIDLKTFREKRKIDCGSPVRRADISSQRGLLLVCCDSGVYVRSLETGDLIAEIMTGAAAAEPGTGAAAAEIGTGTAAAETGTDAAPEFAVWKPDGNTILLIYDRRVDLYALDTEVDEAVTDYLPLYSSGVPLGGVRYYSQDERRIFQTSYLDSAPGQDRLYCWDARTGELLWDSAYSEKSYRSCLTLSGDGSSVWRLYDGDGGMGLMRINGVTGEVLLSARWDGPYWYPGTPVESPDGRRGFILTSSTDERSQELLLFDAGTGERIRLLVLGKEAGESWERYSAESEASKAPEEPEAGSAGAGEKTETGSAGAPEEPETGLIRPEERTGAAKVLFSRDGKKLYCIQNVTRKRNGANGICVDFLDAETGELEDERFLETGPQDITAWDEEEAVVLIDPLEDESNKPGTDYSTYVNGEWIYPAYVADGKHVRVEHTVRILDLREGKITAEVPFSYLRSPEAGNRVLTAVRPFDGGMALYWAAENAEGDGEEYCCRLMKDGSTGTVCKAKSYEGRLLWVSAEEHLSFNGEEAYITWSGIRRMSDAALLLGCAFDPEKIVVAAGKAPLYTGKSVTDLEIAAAKDGSSVCVYDNNTNTEKTPFLILPSDLETLMVKARKRLERKK